MVLTPSTMIALGTPASDFSLPDVVSKDTITLNTFADMKAFLLMFICSHCPFVKHIQKELSRIGRDYQKKNVGILAISSNDADAYPEDSSSGLKVMAQELGFTFSYCYDETQEVARAYQATCTPDFFLFDQHRTLVYRGQLDESRPGNDKPITGKDLRQALDSVLSGLPILAEQIASVGCNIKWKSSRER